MAATVAIEQDDVIESAVSRALAHLDLRDRIRGRIVAVKPNETSATPEDSSGVTQPDTLRAVIRELKLMQPAHLVVTGGAGAGETDEIFEMTGLMDVVREEDVEFVDHNRPPFERVELRYAPENDVDGPQQDVMVSRRVLEYQTLVSLAQLKVHSTATVTLALKNIAMSFPAADYYGHPRSRQDHENSFFADMHSFIAAMAARFHIDAGIIVGHPAMVGTGPLGGVPVESGLVIASDDALAADIAGARILGFGRQAVRHLWEAARLGLGEAEMSKMRFPGLSVESALESFSLRAYGRAIRR
jgi:uncharacterized protein (DUF362 family)